jgi:6-oxo-cyclohex-1-ene-carbonyl-CoA hydrolase
MALEGRAGFRAFNEGPRDNREVDFVALRLRLAEGRGWDDDLIDSIQPRRGER